jgi:alkanesulfonate monooxygenase SsuD/methylene tetrahydromethanopterin reductase-like flavin-dependent oxidoreductase (luciferase family)
MVLRLDRRVKVGSCHHPLVPTFGVHTGLQNTTVADLRSLWRRAEDAGFDAITVWDHLYASDLIRYECHEAVAMHAALACATTRVRCGCLVYCVGYRHAGVLAKAVSTIDHLSGGRAEVGLGAGWAQPEYAAYGFRFPPTGERLDLLDEAAGAIRSLLHDGKAEAAGAHVRLRDARLEPRPVQPHLPVWIGGAGERRTARIVARHGDGWNVPFVAADVLAHKRGVLDDHCRAEGREPGEVRLGVNIVFCDDEASLAAQFGLLAEAVRPGAVVGTSVEQATDALGRYLAAGADQVNVALRAPWNDGALDRAAEAATAALR